MMTPSMRGAGLLAVTFAVGLLAGVALDRSLAHRPAASRALMMRIPHALDQLGLTPEQRRAADSILGASSPRSEAVMREMVPRLAAIADSVNDALRHILTPGQRHQLDSLIRGPIFLLKYKDSSGGARVDTIFKR